MAKAEVAVFALFVEKSVFEEDILVKKYVFGNFELVLTDEDYPLQQDEFTKLFLKTEDKEKKYKYMICENRYDDLEKYTKGQLLERNGLYELYQTSEGKFIIYHWARCRLGFGFYLEDLENKNIITYYFNPTMCAEIPLSVVRFFSCAGIHSKLLQKGKIIFHASYIEWKEKGILFCGSSGVGKSTQAELWRKYEGALIINGDRALVGWEEGAWRTFGYPCCGSSGICINRTLPLSAIVLLEQGEENYIEQLTDGQKIRMLLAGSEHYLWCEKEMERIYQLSKEMIKEVPVVKLICRPNEEAVIVLKKTLEGMIDGCLF